MHGVDSLEVLVAHVVMMPGWVMLGEVVGQVELAWGPDEIEFALVDSVFHPPAVAHVERFGKFLAHFGREDALGSAVVGLERGSSDGLEVAKLFEGGTHWASVFSAHKDASGFGFCC